MRRFVLLCSILTLSLSSACAGDNGNSRGDAEPEDGGRRVDATNTGRDAAVGSGSVGDACEQSLECASERCVAVGLGESVCTAGCDVAADCPRGWRCGVDGSGEFVESLCLCSKRPEICDNDLDDDCDARIDDADEDCGALPDAGVDASADAPTGVPDAGIDGGTDAGRDAGLDAGRDAGRDAGNDSGGACSVACGPCETCVEGECRAFDEIHRGRIATGVVDTCAVSPDGRLYCWGGEDDGEQPRAATSHYQTPVRVGAATDWAQVSVGKDYSCALKTSGAVYCWGASGNGETGIPGGVPSYEPSLVAIASPMARVVAGTRGTCAIGVDRSLWCWGGGGYCIGGNETCTQVVPPERVGDANDWVDVSTNHQLACAVKSDGTLHCWGDVRGIGMIPDTYPSGPIWQRTPKRLGTGIDWRQVSVSYDAVCAVKADDTLWCWGEGASYQTGLGDAMARSTPTLVGPGWRSVALSARWPSNTEARRTHGCGLRTDGSVRCWGAGADGVIGVGTIEDAPAPVALPSLTSGVSALDTGGRVSCAVRAGVGYCWGDNTTGQLGVGDNVDRLTPTALPGDNWTMISTSDSQHFASADGHSCGVRADGSLWCWGGNGGAALGLGVDSVRLPRPPSVTDAPLGLEGLTLGFRHGCGIRASDRALFCWGDNDDGQLGTGDNVDRATATEITPGLRWLEVHASAVSTCGLREDHSLWCWGGNASGQLGLGDRTGRAEPTRVGVASDWSHVATGAMRYNEATTCAVRLDGSLYCWGRSIGGAPTGLVPTRIGALDTWTRVSVNGRVACALKSDRTLHCWGDNAFWVRIGVESTADHVVSPSPVTFGASFCDVRLSGYLGYNSGCAVAADGSAKCWGSTEPSGPFTAATTGVVVASGGFDAQCGMTTHGRIVCSGSNEYGAVGRESTPEALMGFVPGLW